MKTISAHRGIEETRTASSILLVAAVVVVLLVAGALSYFAFSSGMLSGSSASGNGSGTSGTTSTLQTGQSAGSQSGSSPTNTSGSSSSSSSSTTAVVVLSSTTISTDSTSSSSQSEAVSSPSSSSSSASFQLPSGGSEVIIPEGIQNANAKQQNITFDPYNLKVVIGVNNTIYFVNNDMQDNLGHVIESISWPSSGQGFQFFILPGQVYNVTLTTAGTYNYNCEWHPVWMTGTIVVLPHS